ncbi:MAG: hypothetical protein NTZ90_10795 [Proteobacteria bacterium]|nr:hypothetical protein [Pseudomonadota bacterium]
MGATKRQKSTEERIDELADRLGEVRQLWQQRDIRKAIIKAVSKEMCGGGLALLLLHNRELVRNIAYHVAMHGEESAKDTFAPKRRIHSKR